MKLYDRAIRTQHPRPIRVAIVTTSFPLQHVSTSGPFVMEMARHLPEDVQATVITPCGIERTGLESESGYRVRCFRYAPWSWQTLAHGPGGVPAALREKPGRRMLLILFIPALFFACLRTARRSDVIHANWSATGVIAGLAGMLTRTPCITTLRGTDIELGERSRVFRSVLTLCGRLNRRIVAVGMGLRERIARILSCDISRITLIPNGVDKAFFQIPTPNPRPRLRLVTVGSLVPVKGIDTLIKALSLLDREIEWELTLVGDGPERSRLESAASEYGIAARIRFTGLKAPAAIPGILEGHEIFILTSRSEGRPNALIEAMASGRAVIASNIPAVAELVADEENGLIFQVDNAEALASQLKRIHDDPGMIARLGACARQSVATMDWSETGRRYAALYREVSA